MSWARTPPTITDMAQPCCGEAAEGLSVFSLHKGIPLHGEWPEMPGPQLHPMIWTIDCFGNPAPSVWGQATVTSQRNEVCSYLIFLPLNCPQTQTSPMSSFEISFWPQISCLPTPAYKSFRGSCDHSERAQRFWTSTKISISGKSCQPDLRLTLRFIPSRTAPSLCPCALSHPSAWAKCPCPHVHNTPIVTFTTLHLSPRPLLGLLEGPGDQRPSWLAGTWGFCYISATKCCRGIQQHGTTLSVSCNQNVTILFVLLCFLLYCFFVQAVHEHCLLCEQYQRVCTDEKCYTLTTSLYFSVSEATPLNELIRSSTESVPK